MCGIIGYIGSEDAVDILLEGLQRLEYRGYDSAGIAVLNAGQIQMSREVGKLNNLVKKLALEPISGSIGIGHTRWATHGRPTEYNAHPHTDGDQQLVVVHNGIIENYQALKERLTAKGHHFKSQTDTEVIAHLIQSHYQGDLKAAVLAASQELEGAYALAVMHKDQPDYLIAVKKNSPLLLGVGTDANYIASDVPAILRHTREIIYLMDDQLAVVSQNEIQIFDLAGQPVAYEVAHIDWNIVAAEKMGYDHFMLKEIHEQPTAFAQTISGRVSESEQRFYLEELQISEQELKQIDRIQIIACGTAYYAGLTGKYMIEKLARVPVEVALASEYRYCDPIITPRTLVIAISQSGETADTLAAIRLAKAQGAVTLGIINAKGSAITREVDGTLYIHAGPEISVASTKAYMAMLAALQVLALHLAFIHQQIQQQELGDYIHTLKTLPRIMEETLKSVEPQVQEIATHLLRYHHCLYLGRGINFPTALEGALKLKELSYVHAEGYAAGELKHGPIALIDSLMPVIAVATQSETYDKIFSNLEEVKARDGKIIAIATVGDQRIKAVAEDIIYVPEVPELLSPMINVLPLQLLAYYVALRRGYDVDQPRNLAKSVTVE